MEIFLVSPNWIGDCVMSMPAIRALKALRPDLKIYIITKPHLSSIYMSIPEIDEVLSLPSGNSLKSFILNVITLRKYKIKEGILFPNSFKSALTLRLSGVKHLTGYERDMRGWLLEKKTKFSGKAIHQIKSYLDLISLYLDSIVEGSFSNILIFSKDEKRKALLILKENDFVDGEKLIGISAAAAYGSSKEWPAVNFANLINELSGDMRNLRFVMFGSENDENKINEISDSVSVKLIKITGKYTLREAISVISKCDVFIGNDSGLLHASDAAGVPSIGLFGPTSPETTSPPGNLTETIYKSVECSPCSYRECPIDHKCMNEISVKEIFNKTIKILKSK
ncbi:MAG: lipopolysaccharide heptosyltransferase II [Candidatus Aminicenantes bacterium]|nr:lipopolysaccharide heptosyltransferase II [Candidatus Aminicenantes bacterium]